MKRTQKRLLSVASLTLIQFLPLLGFSAKTQAASITSTYTACYFSNGSTETWKWGLAPDDGWYEMSGTWEERQHTGTTYFRPSTATQAAIVQSCRQSQAYYGLTGQRLIAVYAADSAVGRNYEIRLNSGSQIDGMSVTP
ncbi:MAG: hypothetical protein AB8B99_01660 [Phormidesmis sp.]